MTHPSTYKGSQNFREAVSPAQRVSAEWNFPDGFSWRIDPQGILRICAKGIRYAITTNGTLTEDRAIPSRTGRIMRVQYDDSGWRIVTLESGAVGESDARLGTTTTLKG